MKTIRLKGICVNIDKSRNINKLNSLKELCANELNNDENYKGHHRLLKMYINLIDKRIQTYKLYALDLNQALKIDNYKTKQLWAK